MAKLRALGRVCVILSIVSAFKPEVSADERLFETEIRPLLLESCVKCHGPKSQKGGVRLDDPSALLRNSDGDAIIVPGNPEQSRLVKALRHEGDIRMPPKRPLPKERIAVVVDWIRRGAARPVSPVSASSIANAEGAAGTHWAYQPIRAPSPPSTASSWPLGEIDRFVLARLDEANLEPSPPASRAAWLRRVTLTLTGLPPTREDLAAFLADDEPQAHEKVVDRLLASPRFGERWGRHWLDVARYADTKGYVFTSERRFPYSFTFRDYVVQSFNEDLPYDRFVIEQIAADQIVDGSDPRSLAAMGFLTLGRRFLNNPHDIIDDRIDVVTRGLMSLTVQCARCHDHKYDPIPTDDYYSLYGVFASSQEPRELPEIGPPDDPDLAAAFLKEIARRTEARDAYRAKKHAELVDGIRRGTAAYLAALAHGNTELPPSFLEIAGNHKIVASALERWRQYLARRAEPGDAVFGPWNTLVSRRPGSIVEAFSRWRESEASKSSNAIVRAALLERPVKRTEDVVAAYAQAFGQVLDDELGETDATRAAHEELRTTLFGSDAPANLSLDVARQHFGRDVRDRLRNLQRDIDKVHVEHAGAPLRAMTLVDRPTPQEPVVFRRGQPGNPGDRVPRRFLAILSGESRKPFTKGSGRLELARAIASADNPLTARSIVNRVFMHHFGKALVRTPADFGVRSEAPTHPELLDWLASRLIAEGWSLKRLHRRLVLSAAFRQSSRLDSSKHATDPDNRWLWRMNPRRRDFESLRDAMLQAADRLDLRASGKSVDLFRRPFTGRRSVYGYIDRQNLPQTLRTFDFASPDATNPKRHETTVPQQALWLMNGAFAQEQARAMVAREDFRSTTDPGKRVDLLYRELFARSPHAEERRVALEYIRDRDQPQTWERYAQALFLTNEFAFVD